ncbi:MAG: tetratricopeptide repeat protein [Verrucomicrobiales bacterium]
MTTRHASRSHHRTGERRHDDFSRKHRTADRTIASRSSVSKHWSPRWRSSSTVWNHNHVSYRDSTYINVNFRNSVNYAYRPSCWGSSPWWGVRSRHHWHRGTWDYGWNNRWHRRHGHYYSDVYYPPGYSRYGSSYSSNLAWGLAGWSLGSLIYDTGYSTYSNPYSAPPVDYGDYSYSYSEPITVVSAAEVPVSEELAATSEELSTEALDRAMTDFEEGDYLSALKAVDEAISHAPSDPALHEFRALTLFALGRYGDAAGVLNPVLASGPGWDWETMISFYPSDDVYTRQFRRLENYVEGQPESADSRFLLGYHYMVGGFLGAAYEMFDQVVELQPRDTVAVQLRNLVESSMPVDDEAEVEVVEPAAPMEIVPAEAVAGEWKAVSADEKSIDLTLGADGKFTWAYEGRAKGSVLSGEWVIDEDGQLVLTDEDVQLVGTIALEDDDTMHFVLAGSPEGDPGLVFVRL